MEGALRSPSTLEPFKLVNLGRHVDARAIASLVVCALWGKSQNLFSEREPAFLVDVQWMGKGVLFGRKTRITLLYMSAK